MLTGLTTAEAPAAQAAPTTPTIAVAPVAQAAPTTPTTVVAPAAQTAPTTPITAVEEELLATERVLIVAMKNVPKDVPVIVKDAAPDCANLLVMTVVIHNVIGQADPEVVMDAYPRAKTIAVIPAIGIVTAKL